jgi:hypothetical protein
MLKEKVEMEILVMQVLLEQEILAMPEQAAVEEEVEVLHLHLLILVPQILEVPVVLRREEEMEVLGEQHLPAVLGELEVPVMQEIWDRLELPIPE